MLQLPILMYVRSTQFKTSNIYILKKKIELIWKVYGEEVKNRSCFFLFRTNSDFFILLKALCQCKDYYACW